MEEKKKWKKIKNERRRMKEKEERLKK